MSDLPPQTRDKLKKVATPTLISSMTDQEQGNGAQDPRRA